MAGREKLTTYLRDLGYNVVRHPQEGIRPLDQQLVGGTVSIETHGAGNSIVSYEGPRNVVFGFKCLRVGVIDGDVTLTTAGAGTTFLAVEDDEVRTEMLTESCLLDLVTPGSN